MKNLIIVGSWYSVSKVFASQFDTSVIINSMEDLEKHKHEITSSSVILFGGGADISPSLYNQIPRFTSATNQLSHRDAFEVNVFQEGRKKDAGFIGICRGAQLLCALAGGSLYQDVGNHTSAHDMTTSEGSVLNVSSVHHQMMNPIKTDHELLAWSSEVLSNYHLEGETMQALYVKEFNNNIKVDVEPEVVYFKSIKALAIQYHPEFMNQNEDAVHYAQNLVDFYFIKDKK